jgi:hypothetical protein
MDRRERRFSEQSLEQLPDGTMVLRRTWPQLGRMLYQLEHDPIESSEHLNDTQKRELRTKVKDIILDQCSSYERQYEAFEYVIRGRAVEIVGNPSYQGEDGKAYELPYTGLEGCYVGSQAKPGRPGLTPEQIIEEEANIGLELLNRLKKDAIKDYAWAKFARIADPDHHILDKEDLKHIHLLWACIVRRLNQRIYENEECKKTPLEQVEAILRNDSRLANDPVIQQEYTTLKEKKKTAQNETPEERKHQLASDRIFRDRMEEHDRFRRETYALLRDIFGRYGHIQYRIDDSSFADANILEELHLPKLPDRHNSHPYLMKLTTEQVKGYLFLAQLGEKGGDPLARSILKH